MSGIEIGIAVVSAVAALVSAYKDGDKIVQKIKERRTKRGKQLPDPQLEKVLRQGESEIRRTNDEGIETFGEAFSKDTAATNALKDIVIEIQAKLLSQLADAQDDDNFNDFSACINSAIKARLKTLNVLNDLQLRLREQETSQLHPTKSPGLRALDRQVTSEGSISAESAGTYKRRQSWKPWKRQPSSEDSNRSFMLDKRKSIEGQSASSNVSYQSSPTLVPQTPKSEAPLDLSPSSTFSPRQRSSLISSPVITQQIIPISETTKFSGFCKGAYYVQTLQLKKAMEPSMRDMERSYHCKKCDFKVRADNTDRNNPRFDDNVYEMCSVRFRLLFLFKSHLSQSSSKSSRRYRCIICSLSGVDSSIYEGEPHLFEHISHHRGDVLSSVPVEGLLCINADSIEPASTYGFDLYFSPIKPSQFLLPPSAMTSEAPAELDSIPVVKEAVELDSKPLPEEVFRTFWNDLGR